MSNVIACLLKVYGDMSQSVMNLLIWKSGIGMRWGQVANGYLRSKQKNGQRGLSFLNLCSA